MIYRCVCVSALVTYSVVLCTSDVIVPYSDPLFSVVIQCISLYKIFDLHCEVSVRVSRSASHMDLRRYAHHCDYRTTASCI